MEVVVVIPVYKDPDIDEMVSLRQCCRILSHYKMCLVCPEGFDTRIFKEIWVSFDLNLCVEEFNPAFFKNIAGYNRLMLSEVFYLRFCRFDYMLIYQPDAYVFKDELMEWCQKGYDYVGAPLVGQFTDMVFHENCMKVGNGGLSLRKVAAFLRFFEGKEHVYPLSQIARRIGFWNKPYTRWLVWILMAFGWRNTPRKVAERYKWNEDCFWSMVLDGTPYELSKPSPRGAMEFAFERFPSELYAITGKLPFGCHAWEKYQYDTFWKKWIG